MDKFVLYQRYNGLKGHRSVSPGRYSIVVRGACDECAVAHTSHVIMPDTIFIEPEDYDFGKQEYFVNDNAFMMIHCGLFRACFV